MNRIATMIKEARLEAKLSEKDLAKKCGLTASYIIQVESGRKIINEKIAERILKAVGKDSGVALQQETEEKADEKEMKKVIKPQREEFYDIKPNDQWSDALANIIKKFPVHALKTNKVTGYKDLPVLNKKIEGYHWEKISFIKVADDDMVAMRIRKDDEVMVCKTKDISNDSVYLFEMENRRMIRILRKEPNQKISMRKGEKGEAPLVVDQKKVKLIGKCVKVEFEL